MALYSATTLNAASDHYNSARIATAETKRHLFEEVRARVEGKLALIAPGYRMYLASFVVKKAGGKRGNLPMHADPSVVNHGEVLGSMSGCRCAMWMSRTDVCMWWSTARGLAILLLCLR